MSMKRWPKRSSSRSTNNAIIPICLFIHSGSVNSGIALVRAVSCQYGDAMKVKVVVMPKAAVLDPQGAAVRDAMRHLGMPEVRSVRIGKYLEIDVDGKEVEVEARLHGLCRDLLSNPVIEDYELRKD
jgi:phosphoribosylformylglycinamidine synthase subunit PurS